MSKIDECDLATDVVKSVNVLVALRWVALAWNDVQAETITKCFRKAGILNDVMDAVGLVASSPGSPIFSNVARVKRGSVVSNVTYVTS